MAHTEPTILLKPAFSAMADIYAEEMNTAMRRPENFSSSEKYKAFLLYLAVEEILDILHGNGIAPYDDALIAVGMAWLEEAGYVYQGEDEEAEV